MKLNFLFLTIVLGIVTTLMWVFGSTNNRFTEVEVLADANTYPWSESDWLFKGDIEEFVFNEKYIQLKPEQVTSDRESYIFYKRVLPAIESSDSRLIRAQADIEVTEPSILQPGKIVKEREAAFMVWSFDKNENVLSYLTVQSLPAYFVDQISVDKAVKIPADTDYIGIVIMLKDSDATFVINSIGASLVVEKNWFKVLQIVLFGLFAIVTLLFLVFVYLKIGLYAVAIGACIFVITLFGVIVPDALRREYANPLLQLIGAVDYLRDYAIDPKLVLFKSAHILAFWVVSCFAFLALKKLETTVVVVFVALVFFAFSTESLQLFSYDRETRLIDVGINIIGIALGFVSYLIINLFRREPAPASAIDVNLDD